MATPAAMAMETAIAVDSAPITAVATAPIMAVVMGQDMAADMAPDTAVTGQSATDIILAARISPSKPSEITHLKIMLLK